MTWTLLTISNGFACYMILTLFIINSSHIYMVAFPI